MYYGGFQYSDTASLPVAYKRWFIERINRELSKGNGNNGGAATRALHSDTPEMRQLQGRDRPQAPARLRRFT